MIDLIRRMAARSTHYGNRKERRIIVVSSHILHELERVVDHVTIIKKGKVVLQTSVNELRKRFASKHFIVHTRNNAKYLREIRGMRCVKEARINYEKKIEVVVTDAGKFKKELISMFRGREEELTEFSPFKISLENLFLKIMGREEWE